MRKGLHGFSVMHSSSLDNFLAEQLKDPVFSQFYLEAMPELDNSMVDFKDPID